MRNIISIEVLSTCLFARADLTKLPAWPHEPFYPLNCEDWARNGTGGWLPRRLP